MKFIFINPPREIKSNNIWNIINSENPPLGLALLAAIWDEQEHTSKIIDAAALHLTIPEIIARISPDTNFIGITATTPEISKALIIAQNVRQAFPNIKIIMGGVHPTVFHEELVRNNICDMVVRNEGEIPITELAKSTPLDLIPNLTWRNSQNEVIINPDSAKYVDYFSKARRTRSRSAGLSNRGQTRPSFASALWWLRFSCTTNSRGGVGPSC